jgi:hypothetical protein
MLKTIDMSVDDFAPARIRGSLSDLDWVKEVEGGNERRVIN